jgi:hypothetical protein
MKRYYILLKYTMAETRFNSDPCRISKKLQQMTDEGRYRLNVPGLGEYPCFVEDPHIIPQKWGGNLRTNIVNIDNELRGVNRPLSKDCLGKDEYTKFDSPSLPITYPLNQKMYTEESRSIMPAWTARDLEQVNWYYLPLHPQENTCLPFLNNLSTRILEKDYYVAKVPCNFPKENQQNSLPFTPRSIGYPGGPVLCSTSNSCGKL